MSRMLFWKFVVSCVLIFGCGRDSLTEAAPQRIDSFQLYETIREVLLAITRPRDYQKNVNTARRQKTVQEPIAGSFPCSTRESRSPTPPTSVHKLRPGDIDVVGAMGDSLTASFGNMATNVLQVYVENRGMSWSGGGEATWREYLTLPNILKIFNPNLVGFALNDSLSHHKASQFNVAEGGAMSRDMPWQAKLIVRRMRSDPRVDFNKHWKLITLMIGGNDFCLDICYTDVSTSSERHRKELMSTLLYLKENLPRTLVNLVIAPNLNIIVNFKGRSNICTFTNHFECPCLFGLANQHRKKEFMQLMERWQQVEFDVANDSAFRNSEDFAVVAQPFTYQLQWPNSDKNLTDFSFLSKDCFHFSQKGNAKAANALWNNMMEPVGKKSTNWYPTWTKFLCPTAEHPFIYTSESSNR